MKLLPDWFSKLKSKPKAPTKPLGAAGTAIWGGYVQTIESDADLQELTRYKTLSDILINRSIVAAGTRYYLNLISKAGWKVEPAEDSGAKGEEVAELVDDIIHDMETPWRKVIRRAAMFRLWGFAIQVWTAKKREDGKNGLLSIKPISQKTVERWKVGEFGDVEAAYQRSPQTEQEIEIPRERMLYLVDDSLHDSPEGLGLLRHIAEPARRLKRYEQLEGWGFETDLRGMPVGYAPFEELAKMVTNGELTATQKTLIETPIKNFIKYHIKTPQQGLVLDSKTYLTADERKAPSSQRKWEVELLRSGNTSQKESADAINRINREIARILGVESLLAGDTGYGNNAMRRDMSKSLYMVIDSGLQEIKESAQKDIINPIMWLNGIPKEYEPKLKPDKIQYLEVTEITQALADLAQAGIPLDLDDPAYDEIRDLLGLSKRLNMILDLDASLNEKPKQNQRQNQTNNPDNMETDDIKEEKEGKE